MTQFVEATSENVETIQRRAAPDRPFDLTRADPRVGSKNEYLASNTSPDPFSYFNIMFSTVLSKITKDTNIRIMHHNNAHNLRYSDPNFVTFIRRLDIVHYFGLIMCIQLRKTHSVLTRDFIRLEFNKKSEHLFARIKKSMENVESFSYELFCKMNKYVHFGNPPSYTRKMKWVRSTALAYRDTGGYFVPDTHPVTGLQFQVLDIFSMFESSFALINELFLSFSDVNSIVSLDEIMTSSYSHYNPFRSYNMGKADKVGIALYCTNNANDNYLHDLLVLWPSYVKPAHLRPVMGIMKHLLAPFLHTNITVCVDNFYMSLKNIKSLLELGIYGLGVTRRNRLDGQMIIQKNIRPFVKQQKFFVVEYIHSESAHNNSLISLTLYYEKHDKDVCCFLSSSNSISFNNDQSHPHNRRENMIITSGPFSRTLAQNERPYLIDCYKTKMCGTDNYDGHMHAASCALPYRTKKFWLRRLIFRVFTMCTTNAYIKFKSNPSNPKYNYPVFRFHLSFSMVSANLSDFFVAPSSIRTNQQNGQRLICAKCSQYGRQGQRSLTRTRVKCTVCSRPFCKNHYLRLCLSCASDNNMSALPSLVIEKHIPTTKTKCKSVNCKTKSKSSCAFCYKTFCEAHLFAICVDCSPISHPE